MGVKMFDDAEQMEIQFPAQITRDFPERCSDYAKWLKDNHKIYEAFKAIALQLLCKGRDHYSCNRRSNTRPQ